ncbi:MAG: hypothetical protein ACXVRH_01010 [Thermoleophilaceae bacterium]
MTRKRVAVGVAVAVLAAGGSSALSAGAKPVALSGQLTGFARPVVGALDVVAVNANDGTVGGFTSPRGSSYRVSVSPGPYLVAVEDEDFRVGTSFGFSDVTSIGASGRRVSVAPGGPPTAAAAASAPVIVIQPMNVTANAASGLRSGSMQAQVVGALFDRCHNIAHYRLLDGSPQVIDALKREQQLKDQGRLAPTAFNYSPPSATYAISGSGSVDANGNAIVDLTLSNLKTGAKLDHVRGRGDANDISDLIKRFAGGLAARDCHNKKPPGPNRAKHKKHKHAVHHPSSAGPFTATYEGHYTDKWVSGDGQVTTTTDLMFNAEITVELSHGKVSSTKRTLTASGTLDTLAPPFAGGSSHCTLSASGPTKLNMSIEPNPSRAGGPVDRIVVGMALPDYIAPGYLSVAGDPGCNTVSGTLDPEGQEDHNADWGAAASPGPTIALKDLTYSTQYPVHDVDPYSGGTETVTLTDTFTVR